MMTETNQAMPKPSLLPLEYCTIERAAKLLGCEVEDIYHWQQIGAIEFYCHYDGMARLNVEQNITDDDGDLVSEDIDLENQLAGGWKEQIRKILSHMRTSYSWFSVKEFISNPIFPYEVPPGYEIDDEFADPNVQIDVPEWYEQSVLNPENDISIQCSGYWKLDDSFIEEATDDGIDCTFLHYHSTPEIEGLLREWGVMMYIYDLDIHIHKDKYAQSLYLVKSDIQKIHRATHGLEELQTIYNNTKIYKDKRKQEFEITIPKLKTGHHTRGIALGVMAKLLAETNKHKFMNGKNINASELGEAIAKELGRLQLESISADIRKDVGACVKLINEAIDKINNN